MAILGELCGRICKLAGTNKKHVSVKYYGRNFERKRKGEEKEGGIRKICSRAKEEVLERTETKKERTIRKRLTKKMRERGRTGR